ncbi:MAG: hypothetical protein GF393_09905 [Armatimonadia bacterium]|nr:hypothetical protein [Armatimonadia bacterium]
MYIDERLDPEERALLALVGEVAADAGGAAFLVGGPVRDLLLGRHSPDIDIAVEGPVAEITEALARRLHATVRKTTEFMTSTLVLPNGMELDIARTRTETYPKPGALPVVEGATLAEDLGRRDFTVNAMGMSLAARHFGELIDPHRGRGDLQRRHLRVLHDDSFADDPTRMLRAARFMLRLDLTLEARTAELLARAVVERRPAGVSGARLRNELDVIFREAPARGLPTLQDLRLLEGMALTPASERAREAAGLLPGAARALEIGIDEAEPTATCLGLYAGLSEQDAAELAERLMLDAAAGHALTQAAALVGDPPDVLSCEARCSDTFCALCTLHPAGALAMWTVLDGTGRRRLERYWHDLRGACADIDGSDLIAAGHEPGPGFAAALDAALAAKLDEGANRAEQLRVADERLKALQ